MAKDNKQNKVNINKQIRAKEVRVIDAEGGQLGVMPIYSAIAAATEVGFDLVEISPNATPPVCKIMDYGRYKYELTKKQQEAKKKQSVFQIKEIKLRPKTGEHDLQVKIEHIKKFLEKKDKVKVTVTFKGREITLSDMGNEALDKIIEDTKDIAIVEQSPKLEGRAMAMVLSPK
ncbi:MAG: translation initiation factor IF-3 [Desulfobacterales bacterium]|nr:translation initiation factor IF-3 [Desulfobacterales bacterium]